MKSERWWQALSTYEHGNLGHCHLAPTILGSSEQDSHVSTGVVEGENGSEKKRE